MQALGNFKRIYPCETLEETEEYDEFMHKSQMVYKQKFGINIIRNVRRAPQESEKELDTTMVKWNQCPQYYSKAKVEKVYGLKPPKTSHFQRKIPII